MVERPMYVLPERGMSHGHETFSLRILSFSPRLSFLPTRSAITPNRKMAMAFFASSSMTNLLVVVFPMLSGPRKGYRRKKPVGSHLPKKDVTEDESEKEAGDEDGHIGQGDVGVA